MVPTSSTLTDTLEYIWTITYQVCVEPQIRMCPSCSLKKPYYITIVHLWSNLCWSVSSNTIVCCPDGSENWNGIISLVTQNPTVRYNIMLPSNVQHLTELVYCPLRKWFCKKTSQCSPVVSTPSLRVLPPLCKFQFPAFTEFSEL